jgi:chorismate lyase/3-hydroxybenzoate synthase
VKRAQGDRLPAAGAPGDAASGPATPGAPGIARPSLAIALGEATAGRAVLAEIGYGLGQVHGRGHPQVELDLPLIAGPAARECFTSDGAITPLESGGMRLAMNGAVLFGYLPAAETPGEPLDASVYRVYRHILGELPALGYPHLLRIWNYFPGINREEAGLERYQRFCLGRYQAFAERQADFQHQLPAATAIGTRSGPCQVFFLAGRWPGLHVENPRQVSAYQYPPVYGPKSPSFARATLYDSGRERHLFIAGTSSIIGHSSHHPGEPYCQAVETLRNIEAVIATARSLRDEAGGPIGLRGHEAEVQLKVYIRRPEDYAVVREAFYGHPSFPARCIFLTGDICRANLLVEAEALVTEQVSGAPV